MSYRFFFDYIYYRIKKKFYRRDHHGFLAIGLITLMQIWTISGVLLFMIKELYDRTETAPYSKSMGKIGGVITLVVLFLNYRMYHKNYWKYWEHWKDEPRKKWVLKGWLVVLSIIISFLIFYASAAYK